MIVVTFGFALVFLYLAITGIVQATKHNRPLSDFLIPMGFYLCGIAFAIMSLVHALAKE